MDIPNVAAQMVQNQYQGAVNASPEQASQGLLQGTQAADDMVNRRDSFNENIGNPQSEAIRSKFSQAYQRDKQALKTQTNLDSRNSYFQKLQSAADLVQKEQALNHQKQMLAYQAKRDKQKARGALLGTVLGIGGTAAGAYFGGPGGAMAGGAIGQGTGQAVGGA